jgi:hypothetical protein
MRPHRVVTVPAGMTKPAAPACMHAADQLINRKAQPCSTWLRSQRLCFIATTQPKLERTCCANMQSNIFANAEGSIDLIRLNIEYAATDCFPFWGASYSYLPSASPCPHCYDSSRVKTIALGCVAITCTPTMSPCPSRVQGFSIETHSHNANVTLARETAFCLGSLWEPHSLQKYRASLRLHRESRWHTGRISCLNTGVLEGFRWSRNLPSRGHPCDKAL